MKIILFFLLNLLLINSCNVMDLAGVVDGKVSSDFLRNPYDRRVYFTVGDRLSFANRLSTAAATSESVTLYNNSGEEIEIIDFVIESNSHFNIIVTSPGSGACESGLILSDKSSCSISITAAAPTGSSAYYNDKLKLEYRYNGRNKSNFVTLEIKENIVDSILFGLIAPYDFGSIGVGSYPNGIVNIGNDGDFVTIGAPYITNSNFAFTGSSFPGTGGTCPASGETFSSTPCTVNIELNGATVGQKNAYLVIPYDNGLYQDEYRLELRATITPANTPPASLVSSP